MCVPPWALQYFNRVERDAMRIDGDGPAAPSLSSAIDSTEERGSPAAAAASNDPATPVEADTSSPPSPKLLAGTDGMVSYFVKVPSSGDNAKHSNPKRTRSLAEIIGVYTDGPYGRRKGESGHTVADYQMFLNLIT